ncbi:MAG: PAS domain-containing protein, partial [Acidobacteriota bacterium]
MTTLPGPDVLGSILEFFNSTLDLDELVRRIVHSTMDHLQADRAWLLYPASLTEESASVVYEATKPDFDGALARDEKIPLAGSRKIIETLLSSNVPVVVDGSELDPVIREAYGIRSQIAQALYPAGDQPWAFGLHQCRSAREWTSAEIELFHIIGRYASIALSNATLHRRAVAEAARTAAIVDQIPEAAAIFGTDGKVLRINAAAERDPSLRFYGENEQRILDSSMRRSNGGAVKPGDLPSARALAGETVHEDIIVRDARSGEDRTFEIKAGPVRDAAGTILGAVLIASDITAERQSLERDKRRRRRDDCLATLGLDLFSDANRFADLDGAAQRVGEAIQANVMIYIYRRGVDLLELTGAFPETPAADDFQKYVRHHPYRSGEGLAGTVFQIAKPMFFSAFSEDSIQEFARNNEEEKQLKRLIHEQSLIACPIESADERVGALVISSSEPHSLDAEDLAFAQAVAERIAAAVHTRNLHQMSQEGQRVAAELARREVEARARFEAVLDSAPVGVAVISADELRFELANPLFMEHALRYGRISPETSLIGLRAGEVVPGLERRLRESAEIGETHVDEAVEIRKGQDAWYVRQIISPVQGRYTGMIQSLTVLVQDVSEQVRARREIEALAQVMEERSARLTSILGSMTDALWVYDATGRVVDVNPAALSMFGLGSRSEAITHGTLADLNLRYPDGKPISAELMPFRRALNGEVVPDLLSIGRNVITRSDIDLSIAAAPIESGNNIVGAVLVMRDVTALQELDRKKDEFLSVASHELRTPLTTIKGYTQLLWHNAGNVDFEERSTYLRAVLGEIERMMGLITELLDVSRIETKRLQLLSRQIEWADFINKRVSAFRVQNPLRTIRYEAPPPGLRLTVDADRMRQVVDNLLSNALKYSPEETEIQVSIAERDGRVETSVVDQGIGIPSDEIPRLFERFHRARNVSSRYYGG